MRDTYPIGTHLTLHSGLMVGAYGHRSQDYRLSPLDPWQAMRAAQQCRTEVEDILANTPPGGTGLGIREYANQLACLAMICLGLATLTPGEPPTTADAWRVVGNAGLGPEVIMEVSANWWR
jgi:hypothetical protein